MAERLSDERAHVLALAEAELATRPDIVCDRCAGKGYHHGFGEHGHDPDWCEVCGGAQSWRPDVQDVLLDWLLAYRQAARALVECVDTWRAAIEAGDGARAMKIAEQRASSLAALRALVRGE